MTDFVALTEVLRLQAAGCAALGSPFSAALLERAAEAVPAEASFRQVFQPWAPADRRELFQDATALRWLGALHDLALADPESPLARSYPRTDRLGNAEAAWPPILTAMRARGEEIAEFMRHEPQTNEARRSAVLLPGFLTVAAETRLPLRILELGASAGLNQLWDKRRYRLGDTFAWGPKRARVNLEVDWHGGSPPLNAPVRVIERHACDRSPINLTDPVQRRRLRAFVWPDQTDRLERLDAAIAETLAGAVKVEREDAVVWARRHAAPRAGVATVLFHSVFIQYMLAASQAALVESIHAFGEKAAGPFAWLRMEPAPVNPAIMELRLTLWPAGAERLLATAHPHGAWIEWRG